MAEPHLPGGRVLPESSESWRPVDGPTTSPAVDEPPDRSDADEAAANAARQRYRLHRLEPLEPDRGIRAILRPGERLYAIRHSVAIDPRRAGLGAGADVELCGDLYLTSERLLHVGQRLIAVDLDDIEDAALSGGRILLTLHDGYGVTIDAERPRLLRVQVSTARAARAGPARRPRAIAQSSRR